MTANWLTLGNHAWALPVGTDAGRVVKLFGWPPVNLQVGAYYNVPRPDCGLPWQLRTWVPLIF